MHIRLFHALFLTLCFSLISFGQIILPVEVLGAEGIIESRTINLSSQEASDTERLWLQINNLSYEDKASIRINAGPWYDLNHLSVEMQKQEKARGGMVHGGFNTIRLSIPASGFVTGSNTIDFRFNTSDGISMGYRVVKFNLLNNSGQKLLANERFTEDDPDLWTAPEGTSAADVLEGKTLWEQGNSLWSNYLTNTGNWYDYTLQSSTPIKAACASCHAHDGRDLELFAYSNKSIIERAKFHKLTEGEGKKIAAYIRSLSDADPKINRSGRPWNPPYQPGVQLEGKPIEEWHAGAGIDAVLDKDEDMLSYMFPNGVNKVEVDKFFDQDLSDIDRTTMPIAVQLPDWKHWLPLVHPMDAFDQGGFWADSYNMAQDVWRSPSSFSTKYNPLRAYEDFRAYLLTLPKMADGQTVNVAAMSRSEKDELAHRHHIYSFNHRFFLGQRTAAWSKHWRVLTTDGSLAYGAKNPEVPYTMAVTSLARYFAVKNFEVMHEFGLQDKMDVMWDGEASQDRPSKRHWLNSAESHNVFEVPPHFTGAADDGGIEHFAGQPIQTGQYESTAWYQLQLILAGGEGQQWWNGPVDMNYQPEYILKAATSSGIKEPLRFYHSIAAMYKTKSWSGDVDPVNGRGFNMRQEGPWWFFGKSPNAGLIHFFGHAPGSWANTLNEIQPGLSKLFLDALFTEFLKGVNKHDLNTWPRTGVPDWRLESINKSSVFDVTTNNTSGGTDPYYADHMYWAIPQAIEHGVDCEILDQVIDWSQQAWPNIDFDQFKAQLNPELIVEFNECDERGYEATALNLGLSPIFEWQVNGSSVGDTSSSLSETFFSSGDQIVVTATGENSCPTTSNTKNLSFTVPTLPECIIPVDSAYFSFSNGTFLQDDWNDNDLGGTATQFNEGGDRDHVAQFASNSQYLAMDGTPLKLLRSEVTIETWINLNLLKSNSGNQIQRIVTLNPNGIILYRLNAQDKLEVGVRTTGSNSYEWVYMTGELINDTWTHLAVTISEEEMKIYMNGELNSTGALSYPINLVPSSGDTKVVISDGGFENAEGKIDDVKIYNRVLSTSEILSSYTGIVDPEPEPTCLNTNSDFSLGGTNWSDVWSAGGVSANSEVVSGEMAVTGISGATANWHVQLETYYNFQEGETYTISFDARADVVADIIVATREAGGSVAPENYKVQAIGTTMATYSIEYVHFGGSYSAGQMLFYLGNFGNVYLDNVCVNTGVTLSNRDIDENLKSRFFVYPNPTQTILNINASEAGTVQIISLRGEVLKSINIESETETSINIEDFSSGIYLCRYTSKDQVKILKIIRF